MSHFFHRLDRSGEEYEMVLVLFAVLGFAVGYRLGITRRGFVAMAAAAVGMTVVQIGHLLTTSERSGMTMLPVVIGAIVVISMLFGALVQRATPDAGKAA